MGNLKSAALALALVFGFAGISKATSVETGGLLVIDQTAGTGQRGELFIVNQTSGTRAVFSDFGRDTQGPTGVDPNSVGWMPPALLGLLGPSAVLVTDGSAGTNGQGELFKIDPTTGNRELLSDFGDSNEGPVGQYPCAVLVIAPGLLNWSGILVADPLAGTNDQGAIFSVDSFGNRVLVSDFGIGSNQGQYPDSMAYFPGLLGLGSTVLVADGSAGTNSEGELFAVNPATGARTVLSDFGNSHQGWVDTNPQSTPMGVAVSPSGQIYVLVQDLSAGGGGAVVRVDPISGHRTRLSDFSDASQGAVGVAPNGIAWLPSRGLLAVTDANGSGTMLTVDPASGQRHVLSDFGESAKGPIGNEPSGLTIAQ
ncbi:SMP-30/gluconolactonase/LRE family protein [Burkholderia sp. MS455]|uniref:hypothetical protein n=1 Tax=Burkholderia sp. MS455 TaxID=2811788 RepID=UPI001958EC1B|nr:hypothetical protein [Burkholderia sp. MS455]QRR07564.1 SMP-30/gluconolactonase/LRE family protein [Burkholderia sp. MS455]